VLEGERKREREREREEWKDVLETPLAASHDCCVRAPSGAETPNGDWASMARVTTASSMERKSALERCACKELNDSAESCTCLRNYTGPRWT
jgi:hypothetical protein